ncbi:hypothetical protein [Eremococcus coleocola]|uniref:hypothetical protein n=1 Tax=Eremococcus coleocola TaxID=88132 RepID=UPI00048677DB|nr:hypothetical protein [Eremococcus coleocola]
MAINARQEKFLLALLQEPNVTKACRMADVPRSTANRWLSTDKFQEAYKQMRRNIMDLTTTRLQYLSTKATEVLEQILDDNKVSPYAKIQACNLVLEKAYHGLEIDMQAEILERLEALENEQQENF